MFAIAQGPTKQKASDAISILSGRLQTATLLEDRRNAVVGLRSFAREYPASVASGALRGLIGSLGKDREDIDTVKVVLETLLVLFSPDENSPEASEEIELWLADEFTQRQDNITLLLDILEINDSYLRLYSLQLLSAILASRTERTEECIFTAPLGISRLVAVLDDKREAVRNEGLSLLTYLTPNSSELQKLVAFENAFERIFSIIKAEGSLSQGGRIVEDCLILMANLLRMNVSNQSFFRETGSVPKLASLLGDILAEQQADSDIAEWAVTQRNRNTYALLAVLRLFLVGGEIGTQANQASFWHHGILKKVLDLAFSHATELQIKAEALLTCADLIRGNSALQEGFANFQVPSVLAEEAVKTNGAAHLEQVNTIYVIDGLLDITLSVTSTKAFDARFAACECIKAYFYNHPVIRLHFLRRAIDGHTSGADETANVLSTLLRANDVVSKDPYRSWFAAVILFHLIFEDPEAKALALGVSEGDATQGEEVVTCVQSLTANLVNGIQSGVDERILVGFLMLLCGWLFEDPDSVNDFLGEGSNVQSLVQAVSPNSRNNVIVQGLCAMLLGLVYEYSTKDSPVPRAALHQILTTRMGRDRYIDRLTTLRKQPLLRDFEVLPQRLSSAQVGLPDVYFDRTFVEFAKDNFSRVVRAIDRDPGLEVPVITNGIQKGISRELVDSLRAQLDDKDKMLQQTQANLADIDRQLSQEKLEHRRMKETSILEISRIKNVNEALQRHHDEDLSKLRLEHSSTIEQSKRTSERAIREAQDETERIRNRNEAEIADLKNTIGELKTSLDKANKNHLQDLQTAHDEFTSKLNAQTARLERAEDKLKDVEVANKLAQQKTIEDQTLISTKESQRAAAQSELDDLLMVFGDVEEKASKYKARLEGLGETVSDDEGESDAETGEDETDADDDVD